MKKVIIAMGLCFGVMMPVLADSVGGNPTGISSSSFNQNAPVVSEVRYNDVSILKDGVSIKIAITVVYKTTLRTAGLRAENAVTKSVGTVFKAQTGLTNSGDVVKNPNLFVDRLIWYSNEVLGVETNGATELIEFKDVLITDA